MARLRRAVTGAGPGRRIGAVNGEPGSSAPEPGLGEVRSADGTAIGYQRVGTGPAVVLLHGAGQCSANLLRLARALSGAFTVYVPDRRGRGRSGPYGEFRGLSTEIDDLSALLDACGAAGSSASVPERSSRSGGPGPPGHHQAGAL